MAKVYYFLLVLVLVHSVTSRSPRHRRQNNVLNDQGNAEHQRADDDTIVINRAIFSGLEKNCEPGRTRDARGNCRRIIQS